MTIEMIIMEEVEVGLENDDPHIIIEGMTETAVRDQGQELVQVENMTILPMTVLIQ